MRATRRARVLGPTAVVVVKSRQRRSQAGMMALPYRAEWFASPAASFSQPLCNPYATLRSVPLYTHQPCATRFLRVQRRPIALSWACTLLAESRRNSFRLRWWISWIILAMRAICLPGCSLRVACTSTVVVAASFETLLLKHRAQNRDGIELAFYS